MAFAFVARRHAPLSGNERITRSLFNIANDVREVDDDAEATNVADLAEKFNIVHDSCEWFGAS